MIDLITLHPKIVHFPIALIFTGLLFEILYLIKKNEFFEKASRWLFHLGFLSAIVSTVSGLISADAIGHDSPAHDKVHDHRNWMVIATISWGASVVLLEVIRRWKQTLRAWFIIGFIPIMILFIVGTDMGGKLVFEYGVGVKMPQTQKANGKKSQKEGQNGHHRDHSHEHKH